MCGLTGFLDLRCSTPTPELDRIVTSMASAIVHRGPDDSGTYADERAGFALGFRRLSIIDLSPAGHQPMTSASGRYVIAFNGEVYNFERIRKELEASGPQRWRGHSDTEVMLAAIERWGVRAAVERFIGMFAIALWDRAEQELTLIRDRVGVKPMYYGSMNETFFFGSELKALRQHPSFDRTIDQESLSLYMRFAYVPGPRSIYRNVWKLPPGTMLRIRSGTPELPSPEPYWSAHDIVTHRVTANLERGEAADELDALLRDAVGLRMISDVPLGVFLSGGIDSSTVAALMQVQSARPVKTFSIGFSDAHFNEAAYAAEVARHLGTDHTEMYVSAVDALAVVPQLPRMFDEPFADSSQIPTHLVSALARRHVTVSLSGDGGDELFGGYNRYFVARALWRRMKWVPAPGRRAAASMLRALSPAAWNRVFGAVRPLIPRGGRMQNPGAKLYKLARALDRGPADFYAEVTAMWRGVTTGGAGASTIVDDPSAWPASVDAIELMMFLDLVTYLPDDILTKVDRASMAVSLESREPLLDHRLVEFAWRLPLRLRTDGTTGKIVLRDVLRRYVPDSLINRPKMGFAIPVASWLTGPLRDWAEPLLTPERLESSGLDAAVVRETWRQQLAGTTDAADRLWTVLMYEAWLEEESLARPCAEAPLSAAVR